MTRAYVEEGYFTPRERDIVKLLAEGNTPKQAASILGLSKWTVWNLLSRAVRRNHSNQYDLVYLAHKRGIVE